MDMTEKVGEQSDAGVGGATEVQSKEICPSWSVSRLASTPMRSPGGHEAGVVSHCGAVTGTLVARPLYARFAWFSWCTADAPVSAARSKRFAGECLTWMATISLMATGCLHERASAGPGDGNDAERTSALGVLIASPTCFTCLTPNHRGGGVDGQNPVK